MSGKRGPCGKPVPGGKTETAAVPVPEYRAVDLVLPEILRGLRFVFRESPVLMLPSVMSSGVPPSGCSPIVGGECCPSSSVGGVAVDDASGSVSAEEGGRWSSASELERGGPLGSGRTKSDGGWAEVGAGSGRPTIIVEVSACRLIIGRSFVFARSLARDVSRQRVLRVRVCVVQRSRQRFNQ